MNSMESKTLIVKKAKNGKGLFVKKNFKARQKIFEVKGKIVSTKQFMRLSQKIKDNTFRFDEEHYLVPTGEFGDFINHSCKPNCSVRKIGRKIFIFSIKNIKESSELLIDYSTIIADDDWWKMRCNCKSKNCRKIVNKFITLPKKVQKKYLGSEMVPEYIYSLNN